MCAGARDCQRLGLLDAVIEWLGSELRAVSASLRSDVDEVRETLEALEPELRKTIDNSANSDAIFRRQLTTLTRIVQATCLLRRAGMPSASSAHRAITSAFIQLHLVTQEVVGEPSWLPLIDAVLE